MRLFPPVVGIALALVGVGVPPAAELPDNTSVSLAKAVRTFNASAASNPIGKEQPPLTTDEVIAAIRAWSRPKDSPVSEELHRAFKRIAATRKLPPSTGLERITHWDPGDSFVFDVWWVRLAMPKADGGTYSFPIRDRLICSRTLVEEADRLEKVLRETPPVPGRYRLEDRIERLRERAEATRLQPTSQGNRRQ
ncbi:MAG: hypothetical protein JSU70_09525 [Phycisphaerales bacterium]|nr:MAG: hypothetical protein JSU70_09525 [Phycisphaerales bacterium]